MRKLWLAACFLLGLGSIALGQSVLLSNLPPSSVVGRLGSGQNGPAQAIPFATLLTQLNGPGLNTQGVINVRLQFAAVPDGSTDNSTAITNAFATSNLFTSGTPTVYFDCNPSTTTCVYNYGGSGTSPIHPTIPTAILCAPGVTLNYTGTAHAADIGPGTTPLTSQAFIRYLIDGCRWTGGANYTAGIYFNNWVLQSAILHNTFNNFGNQTGYNITYAGPNNWDALVAQSFWYDTDGATRNMIDAHQAISLLRFTDNSSECTAIGSPCTTTGIGLWIGSGNITGNILQYHQPLIRLSSNATSAGFTRIYGNHLESNSGMTSPAISYGDPSTAGVNISFPDIFENNLFVWNATSGTPTIGPETASSGSHQLSQGMFTNNTFSTAPTGGAVYINTNGGSRSSTNWNVTSTGVPLSYASSPALVDRAAVNDFALYNFGAGTPTAGFVAAFNSTADGLQIGAFHEVSLSLTCTGSGSGTSQTCTIPPAFFGAVTKDAVIFTSSATNTASMTLNVNGTAATIKKNNGTANLAAGDLKAGIPYFVTYDGTNYDVALNTAATELTALTFSTLPTPVAGMQAYISDGLAANCGDTTCTTWGTTVTGGTGALKLLIWYNGTNWTLAGK